MSGDGLRLNPTELTAQGNIGRLYGSDHDCRRALAGDFGLHNVLGYEKAFAADSVAMDYLRPESSFYFLKQLATEIYMDIFAPHLDPLPATATVLDAGCGIGRFTLPLAERFAEVTAFDACRSAVLCAKRHIEESSRNNVDLQWADASRPADLPPASFDVLWAMEWICYTADPARTLGLLARVARPNARLFLSVEALPGALFGAPLPEPEAVSAALAGQPVLIPEDRYVRYFHRDWLTELVTEAGFVVIEAFDAHYFGEGPLWQALDDARLSDAEYRRDVRAAERACRGDDRMRNLARTTGVVARKA